jgi:inhibitor of cysteine peptidase
MKHFKKILLIALSCLVLSVNAAPVTDNNFTDPSKTIQASQKNPQFTITLRSNPTTGYMWFLDKYNANFITVVEHRYQPPISQLVGAGGKDVWTFKLTPAAFTAPHLLKIKMTYARPWAVEQGRKDVEFNVTTD